MSVNSIKKAISKKTKAICMVHVLGNGGYIEEVRDICNKKKIWLIEDTCESLGVKKKNKYLGTFGDIGTYSFYFSHHITTVEGGMIVTNNDYLAIKYTHLDLMAGLEICLMQKNMKSNSLRLIQDFYS